MVNEEINLYAGKRNIPTRFCRIKVKNLHYYPYNPRISSILMNFKDELNDEVIHKLLDEYQGEATRSLFQQIKKDGVVNEPIIVYKNQVLEGNTRLWVVRELLSKSKKGSSEEKKWSTLPCRLIEEKIGTEEINYILCNVHIKRKRDWSPFEQACYLARMNIGENMSFQQIKEISTFSISMIKNYIEVYKEMERVSAKPRDWNRYYEAYKDEPVKQLQKSGKIDVMKVIKEKTAEGKMGVSNDSRKIKKILTSERASDMFFKKDANISRAYEVAISENPQEGDPLLKRISDLGEDLIQMRWDKLKEIEGDKRKIEIIKKFTQQLKGLCKQLKIKI